MATRDLAESLLPGAQGNDESDKSEISCQERWLWTLTLYAAIVAVGVALAMLGPTLLDLSASLQISAAVASSLFSVRALGYLLGATLGGDLLDRSPNPAWLLLVGTSLTAAAAAFLPQTTSVFLAYGSFLCQGGIMGLLDTGGNVLMLTVWRGSKHINAAVHGFHFLFGVGAFLAPVCVSLGLQSGFSPVQSWLVTGISFLPACVGFLSLVPRPQPKTSSTESEGGALDAVVLSTGAFLFAYVGLEVAFGGYVDSFAIRQLRFSDTAAANLNSVYWGALSISRLVATLVTPHVDHLRYIQVHLVLAWLSLVALCALCAGVAGDVTAGLQIPFCTWLYGFALGPLFPGAMLLAEEKLRPKALDGRAAGFTVACAACGEMCLPLITGFFFAEKGPDSFPAVQLAVCTLAGVAFARLATADV